MIAVAVAAAALAAWRLVDWVVHHQRREFQRAVRVGITQADVLSLVGPPRDVLPAGGVLGGWGGESSRVMTGETWLYYLGPDGIDRLAVVFGKGVVVLVIHDRT